MVGLEGFNDDATETKGISLFSINILAALPESNTDEEVEEIRSLVAHEYFHNWSGRPVLTANCKPAVQAAQQPCAAGHPLVCLIG
jgi:aminopeptidase N